MQDTNNKQTEKLINNVIGQLNGIKKMIGNSKSELEVATQMKAAKSAFDSLMSKYIMARFVNCIDAYSDEDKEKLEKLINDLVKS